MFAPVPYGPSLYSQSVVPPIRSRTRNRPCRRYEARRYSRADPAPCSSNQTCAGVSSSFGSTAPVTQSASGSAANRSAIARNHPGSTSTSSSVNATNSPWATRIPALRAAEAPGRGCATNRIRGSTGSARQSRSSRRASGRLSTRTTS